MSEKIRTATVRDIDNYLSDDAEVCAWEDVKNVLDAKNKEISELNDKLQNVSSLINETREWLVESQKLHKRCADNAVKVIRYNKYKRCMAMAKWCEATALWCYQAANTLPVGFHATLHGKPVMIEPERLFKRSALLTKWNSRWLELAERFKESKK